MNLPFEVVIAAGGRGVRMGKCGPKSLVEIDGEPLLNYTLKSLREAGFKSVLVCIDDARLEERFQTLCSQFPGVSVVVGEPEQSTFCIVKRYSALCDSTVLFLYGHAPRPPEVLEGIRSIIAPACGCLFEKSSVLNSVRLENGKYLEPPYFLKMQLVERTSATSWAGFFNQYKRVVQSISAKGPPEFNCPEEFAIYADYIRNHSHLCRYAGVAHTSI